MTTRYYDNYEKLVIDLLLFCAGRLLDLTQIAVLGHRYGTDVATDACKEYARLCDRADNL